MDTSVAETVGVNPAFEYVGVSFIVFVMDVVQFEMCSC